MFNVQQIQELIKAVDNSSIEEFKYELEGAKIVLRKQSKGQLPVTTQVVTEMQPQRVIEPLNQTDKNELPAEPVKPVVKDATLHTITSPMVGTFYAAPSPDAAQYVQVGSKVKNNTVVCIVEAMKLMNEIEAEINGEIVEVLVENGQLVEYGQELFLVKPE